MHEIQRRFIIFSKFGDERISKSEIVQNDDPIKMHEDLRKRGIVRDVCCVQFLIHR